MTAIRAAALALTLVTAAAPPAAAHKVIAGLFPAGSAIEGEIALSNGAVAADTLVEVLDEQGRRIGETRTDADGFFTFTPTRAILHRFRADLGAGHVAVVEMPADEVAELVAAGGGAVQAGASAAPLAAAPAAARTAPQTAAVAVTPPRAGLTEAQKAELADLLRAELRPLRREIAAYKEKNDLQTILGGIGYILGLSGIGFYVAARRRLGKGAE